jgi:hypothetical protein
MWKSPEYRAWQKMKDRCLNPKNKYFHHYGGRGITVCARWLESFQNFYADMGPRPFAKHSIDRVNNNGNYEPGNCQWRSRRAQNNNRRTNIVIEFNGESHTQTEWSRITGVHERYICYRLNAGWSTEQALSLNPVRPRHRLTPEQTREICDGAKAGSSITSLAKLYKTTPYTVKKLLKNQ